jgi:hypothetical protein
LSRELILPVLAHSKADKELVQIVAEHRFGLSRPEVNVVAIGGGTGLATLLRGLKRHDVSITAIVTVVSIDQGYETICSREDYRTYLYRFAAAHQDGSGESPGILACWLEVW